MTVSERLAFDYIIVSGQPVALINENWNYLWNKGLRQVIKKDMQSLSSSFQWIKSESNKNINIGDRIIEVDGCKIEEMILIQGNQIIDTKPLPGLISKLQYFMLVWEVKRFKK
ncbi:hypothetical protein HGB47_20080 [Leptospira yasudae]|uniref:hypothetical protein n=1 Tax=Leptospira yasudae TaxID=2202201 RepID=UPI001C4F1406|nr:hypothetical protein [Leptospira yasudae]MBW0435909.1 hypothetical protein [Leptospira yasudae]